MCLFSIIFDTSIFRFDFSGLFEKPFANNIIAIESGLILVQLSASLIICFGFISICSGLKNIIENNANRIDTACCIFGSILCAIIFFGYNVVGYELELTNFVYFTKDIFTVNVLEELKWTIGSYVFSILYYIPLFIVISCASFLTLTTTFMLCGKQNIDEKELTMARLKNRIVCLKFSLYSGALLISGTVIYIFSWQNIASLAITDQENSNQFGNFMAYFMLYWGSAYSFVILFTFVPASMIINKHILDARNTPSGIQVISTEDKIDIELIEEIKLTELQYIVAIFSPLITAILSGSSYINY